MLHYIDISDELCKRQLWQRSQKLLEGAAFTSDAKFGAMKKSGRAFGRKIYVAKVTP
jgi:hypothetical protein